MSCRVRREGDLCPAVVLFGAGPGLAGRRGARSRWALTGSTSGMTGFWSPGTPDHCTRGGSENLVLDRYLKVPRAPAGRVGRCHRPGQRPGDRRVHRWAPTVLGHRTPQGRGPRRHQGADRGAAAAPHPAHRGGARRDRRSGGGCCSLKFGTGSSERVWGTLAQVSLHPRQFRVTGHAPRAACPSQSVDEHPRGEASFADRGHGRPGVVPRRDLGCGVRGCHGVCGSGPPFLGVGGWINPPRAAITNSWPPAGYLRFPGPDQTVIVGPYQVDRTTACCMNLCRDLGKRSQRPSGCRQNVFAWPIPEVGVQEIKSPPARRSRRAGGRVVDRTPPHQL